MLYVLDGWHFPLMAFIQENNVCSKRMRPVIIVNVSHSNGGLFAIYALEQRPALFQRIVAASPALEWDGRLLLTAARDRLRKLSAPVRLDLSVGDEGDNTGSTTAFAKILDELKPAGLDYRFTLYRGENHNSVRLVSFPTGLYWAYRPAS